MLGFETIGSATLICYDGEPILTTDAWVNDDAYFGSWCHDYEIPSAQLDAIKRAKYHWFSHGHPDHLNIDALPQLTQGQFLLSNHHGSRIERDLIAAGHRVQILPDRDWISLSPHIKVCSFTNQNQDSVLLIEINGRLVIDANDSPDYGAGWHIKRIAKHFREVYLCQLHGWGGADMVNVYDPAGRPFEVLLDFAQPRRLRLSDKGLGPQVPLCPVPLHDMPYFREQMGKIRQRCSTEQVKRPMRILSRE